MSLKKPIQIFARLKPMPGQPFPHDIESVEADGSNDEILVFNMKTQNSQEDAYHTHKGADAHRFRYTKVFGTEVSQVQVFDTVCKPVLDSALSGYNGTVFAYGQTGSGKTFTMTGSRSAYEERGIIPRTLSYLFQKCQEMDDGAQLQGVYISYLEIYNENGYDLLHTGFISGKLDDMTKVVLMEDGTQQIHLKNLGVHPIATEDEGLHLFYLGEHNRTIAETPMNDSSTRSHCIFTIHLNIREGGGIVRRSKVHLVDLAGSERLANSHISGQLLNEARHINLALHYLEQVIVALGDTNRTHIPYRNSMMTSILRDSLGGNCMTSMIATLSLENKNIPESLSTCRFSQRVALVTNDATLNEEVDPDLLIAQLKAEVKRLKTTIANSSIKPISENPTPLTSDELNDCWNAVQQYIGDPDEHSILAINPDMRLVQTCFRCLKMACDMSQSKSKSTMQILKYILPESESFPQNQRVQELLKTVAHRDAEIRVLTKMLRDEKDKTRMFNFQSISGINIAASSPCNSPRPQQKDGNMSKHTEQDFVELNTSTEKVQMLSYSSSRRTKAVIDKEALHLDGLSDAKRAALDTFMQSYGAKENFLNVKHDLIQKRFQVDSLKDTMNNSHSEMNSLKQTIMKSLNQEEPQIRETYECQIQTLAQQEKRLLAASKEVEQSEESLRVLYGQLMVDFEDWWNKNDSKKESSLASVASGVAKRQEDMKNAEFSARNSGLDSPVEEEFRSANKLKKDTPRKKSRKIKSSRKSEKSEKQSIQLLLAGKITPRSRASPATSARIQDESEIYSRTNSSVENTGDNSKNEDEKDIMKELPMTGDPSTDREILNFLRKRQAVFRKINEEKLAG